MKKHFLKVTMAAVLLSGVAAWAGDEPGTQPKTPTGGARSTLESSSGMDLDQMRVGTLKVTSVDKKNHKVTFEAQISPEAQFSQEGGQPIRIEQLEKGDEVRAAFDPATGDVKAIQVTKAKSKK